MTEPIDVGGGIVTITNIKRKEGTLIVNFEFNNSNQGYEAQGYLSGILIGNDGIARYSGAYPLPEGYYSAGPGKKYTEGEVGFAVPQEVEDLYLVTMGKVISLLENP